MNSYVGKETKMTYEQFRHFAQAARLARDENDHWIVVRYKTALTVVPIAFIHRYESERSIDIAIEELWWKSAEFRQMVPHLA